MKLRFVVPALALSAMAAVVPAKDARACGGCFIQQQESTVVTGHRMVLAVSPSQSVLWDQIKYSGDPKEFAWVLPVRGGAVIETSTDAWFEALDAATSMNILSPSVSCNSPSSYAGCGSAASFSAEGDGADLANPGVIVLHEGTVGPYETVTLAATEPGALNQWLTAHSYNVDASTQPVIDAYVAEGFDFIALRLQPGQGVRQMKPVRVLTPGAGFELPLRMVAAGTGDHVAMTLFTISESRLAADNFENTEIAKDKLVWSFETQSSNYDELRKKALSLQGGSVWLTPYATLGSLLSPVPNNALGGSVQYVVGGSGLSVDTIAMAYLQRGFENDEASDTACSGALAQIAMSKEVVANPCPFGKKADDPSCTTVSSDQIDSRTLACGALDDIAVALRGLHPKDVWLTRLEADLPRASLAQDLRIKPAEQQVHVENWVRITESTGDPCGVAATAILGSDPEDRGSIVGLALAALLTFILARWATRVRRPVNAMARARAERVGRVAGRIVPSAR